jgi:hypothetical protein
MSSIPPEIMSRVYDSVLPKTGIDAVIAQSVAMSAKNTAIVGAAESGIKLTSLATEARSKTESWADDDALKLAIDAMLVKLTNAAGDVGEQAARLRLP